MLAEYREKIGEPIDQLGYIEPGHVVKSRFSSNESRPKSLILCGALMCLIWLRAFSWLDAICTLEKFENVVGGSNSNI